MGTSLRARLRAGEPSAFGELFDAHASVVFRHGLRLTGDRAMAEDVVSTTFLHAWRLRGRIDVDGGSLRPWLLGIATNVIRNANRSRRRRRDLLARATTRDDVPDFADEVAGRVDDAATLVFVRAALQALRPQEREVIALCVWEGLDYATVAQVLGIPIGTVRSRLSRARRRLATLTEPPARPGQESSGRVTATRPRRRLRAEYQASPEAGHD
jgi:RNA polymerase sigma-70 factor (ECF subfamily)